MFTRVPTLCNKYTNNLDETFTLNIAQDIYIPKQIECI